jgi:hypothetical protein
MKRSERATDINIARSRVGPASRFRWGLRFDGRERFAELAAHRRKLIHQRRGGANGRWLLLRVAILCVQHEGLVGWWRSTATRLHVFVVSIGGAGGISAIACRLARPG